MSFHVNLGSHSLFSHIRFWFFFYVLKRVPINLSCLRKRFSFKSVTSDFFLECLKLNQNYFFLWNSKCLRWVSCVSVSVFTFQMRSTKKVSVWPVAFVGGLRYESPKVNTLGKVYGWKTVFDPHRPFAIDMAGFAVNMRLILSKPQAYFKLRGVKGGYQESSLLKELVTLSDLEPKAANCTKVRRGGSLRVWNAV